MDIQQYISSGIIEAYVLGIASEEEVRALELLSAQYPEVAATIADCRQTMEDYTELHAVPPPEGLKEALWAQLEAESPATGSTAHPPLEHTGNQVDFSAHVNRNGRKVLLYRSLAAAIVLLVGSVIFNFTLWNSTRVTQQELAQLKEEQSRLAASNRQYQEQLQQSKQSLALLTDPAVKPIALAGVGTHTANSALVLWDSRTRDVYLSLKHMPPPPAGKQYQLWAIVDGKPVDLGVYGLQQQDSLQKMKKIPAAQMFAITLEKEGGSPTPTLDQMFVAGKV